MEANDQELFCEGAIPPAVVAEIIQKYGNDPAAGACAIFTGQVRADVIGENTVSAISYTAYGELALKKIREIREDIFNKYAVTGMEVRHSLGQVKTGGICLFVLAAAAHRKAAIEACNEMVERIKAELPVWGKEHFAGEGYQWKTNN